MATICLRGPGNFSEIMELLEREVSSSGMSCRMVDSVIRGTESSPIGLLVFEKYFMRSSNRASLSILITKINHEILVDLIGSGGGQGAFFSFSWGSEKSFVKMVEKILLQNGFEVVSNQ